MGRKKSSGYIAISSCLALFLLLLLSGTSVAEHWPVKALPGYPSDKLPFTFETGYITVGNVEFFYYFVESERNPAADPLFLYYNGGPGCSALNGFFYQIGPLQFNLSDYTGGIPQLIYEPHTWSKTTNLLFLDAPVGTGFTYATTQDAWNSTDTYTAAQTYDFLRNWLIEHPDFVTNPVYIGSDSYAGMITPILAQDIINGNEGGNTPIVNLKGYSIGCPHTVTNWETNAKVTLAHRLALISDTMYETAYTSCNGDYVTSTNANCTEAYAAITQCIELVSPVNVLDPYCSFLSPKQKEEHVLKSRRLLQQKPTDHHLMLPLSNPDDDDYFCHNFNYLLMDIWANFESVRAALHVRPGTVKEFFRCNVTLEYTVDTNDVLPYHENLTNAGLQVIAFSGDHDMVIPHVGIEEWITYLNLTLDLDWRPWFVDGQVAGYTRRYTNDGYRLTYATIKGAGHSPQEFKRKECFEMFERWIHYWPI